MTWILIPEEIGWPMKTAIVFLQTLLFTWESVWKKNEFEKSSILEIFHKYGIKKSNKILIFSFKSDTKWVTEFMKQVSCISLLLYMYYECPKLPVKNCHFLISEGENLEEKRFVKIVFLSDFLSIFAIFSGKVAILR